MKLKIDIDPDIVALMQAEIAAGEKAVSAAMREAGTFLKSAWRSRITGAGLGTRLAGAVRQMRTSLRFPDPTAVSGGEKAAPLSESGGAGQLVVVPFSFPAHT